MCVCNTEEYEAEYMDQGRKGRLIEGDGVIYSVCAVEIIIKK